MFVICWRVEVDWAMPGQLVPLARQTLLPFTAMEVAKMLVEETTVANRLVVVTFEAVAFERVTLPSEDRPVTERVPEREAEVPERVAILPVPILRVVMVPLVPVKEVKFNAVVVTPEKVALPPVRVAMFPVPTFSVVTVPEVAWKEVEKRAVAVALVVVTFARVVPPRTVSVDVTVELDMMMPPKA